MNFKKQIIVIVLLSFSVIGLQAQDQCNAYFPFKTNTVMGYSYFNSKGKLTGKSVNTVKSVSTNADGSLTAEIEVASQDKKGRETSTGSYHVNCKDNALSLNITEVMAPNMKASLESMELDITGDIFELPFNLKAGQELPDTQTEISAGTNGVTIISMAINHTNRMVEGMEKVHTEAGSFDCIKISYDVSINMMITKNFHVVSWYSKETGLVKQETYNKRGQLDSKTELTGLKKGK